jgi:uncharacterized protein with PQ loop repeat
MIESINALNLILFFNSILIIALILNQNESSRDAILNQNSVSNPLEKFTWASFLLQIVILLIKIKVNDF